jgi:hypothetical protein
VSIKAIRTNDYCHISFVFSTEGRQIRERTRTAYLREPQRRSITRIL